MSFQDLTVAATGHRPGSLQPYGGYSNLLFNQLITFARKTLRDDRPKRMTVGMALGWDQAVAQACVDLDIPFTAAVPFEGQESTWPDASRARYARLLAFADHVQIICDKDTMPVPRAMQKRNEWMVDQSQAVMALWNGSFGGTHNCIRYAEKQHVPVTNIWEKFHEGWPEFKR